MRRATLDPANNDARAGSYLGQDETGGMRIATGDGGLVIHELQPAGGKTMPARAFLNGNPITIGDLMGTTS